MQKITKKIVWSSLMLALVFSTSPLVANASTDPVLTIKKTKDTSVTMQVKYPTLKNKTVKIKVRISNNDTDKVSTVILTKKLSGKGNVDIKVSDLTEDTAYAFKVMVKKSSDNDYSSYSNEVTVNSGGSSSSAAPSISVADQTDNSVSLSVKSKELAKKKVTIKVRVQNNDNDNVYTVLFTKTLNSKGKATVKIADLSSDTEYAFKAMIKKSSKGTFSDYSNEEKQKTDN